MPRTKLTPEKIAELDKYSVTREYHFVWFGMLAGIIEFDPKFRVKRLVRVKKS